MTDFSTPWSLAGKFALARRARADHNLKPAMYRVLEALLDVANNETGACFRSQPDLQSDTTLSLSGVRYAVSGLEDLGYIKQQPSAGRGRAISYTFGFHLLSQPMPERCHPGVPFKSGDKSRTKQKRRHSSARKGVTPVREKRHPGGTHITDTTINGAGAPAGTPAIPNVGDRGSVLGNVGERGSARERAPLSNNQDRNPSSNAATDIEGRIRRDGDAPHRASQPQCHARDAEAQAKGWQSFAHWKDSCFFRDCLDLTDGPVVHRDDMRAAKAALRRAKPSQAEIRRAKEEARREMDRERKIADLRAGRSTDGMTIANVGAVEGELGRAFLVGVIAAEISPMPKRARGGALEKRVSTIRAELAAEGHRSSWIAEICADIDAEVLDEVFRRDDVKKERRDVR